MKDTLRCGLEATFRYRVTDSKTVPRIYEDAADGAVFGNREQVLPRQNRGYYREYTVKTPGERTRGARRIIWGRGGEFYYTQDHYNHFRRVRE